jgi:RNA polymerase sigma-70 factor (ECF subfamily)
VIDALDREIIMLVHWEGFTSEEVARILGVKPATVRSRHLRIRAYLHEQMLRVDQLKLGAGN